jgi:hypothetical protein
VFEQFDSYFSFIAVTKETDVKQRPTESIILEADNIQNK